MKGKYKLAVSMTRCFALTGAQSYLLSARVAKPSTLWGNCFGTTLDIGLCKLHPERRRHLHQMASSNTAIRHIAQPGTIKIPRQQVDEGGAFACRVLDQLRRQLYLPSARVSMAIHLLIIIFAGRLSAHSPIHVSLRRRLL